MKTKNNIAIITLIALVTPLLCCAQEVFLHNDYRAPIYYKRPPQDTKPKKLNNNVRISLGPINAIDTLDMVISSGSTLSSYYNLKPTFTTISFAASQHPNQDAVIYIEPSNFYQPWNIRIDWEKKGNVSSFSNKDIVNQAGKEELLKMLTFIRKPAYKQGQGKNQRIVQTIDRTNDRATNMAIEMVQSEKYDGVLLSEIYDLVNTQIPFQLSYQDEVQLKQNIISFIKQEISRLKH